MDIANPVVVVLCWPCTAAVPTRCDTEELGGVYLDVPVAGVVRPVSTP